MMYLALHSYDIGFVGLHLRTFNAHFLLEFLLAIESSPQHQCGQVINALVKVVEGNTT